MISVRGLSKSYQGVTVLDNISLEIETGVFGLLGPNGAGKTTLIRILATLVAPDKGEVVVNGYRIGEDNSSVRRCIGYVPQIVDARLNLTVVQFLDYVAALKGLTKAEAKRVIPCALATVDLEPERNKKLTRLSGGMKRRLGIAQALIGSPKVLLVDEPTVGLDPEQRLRLRNLLTRLGRERVVLVSTHMVSDVEQCANRVAILHHGRVLFAGTPDQLLEKARGAVWQAEVEGSVYSTISRQWEVAAVQPIGNQVALRIIATERPLPAARLVQPQLEDAYLAVLQQGRLKGYVDV